MKIKNITKYLTETLLHSDARKFRNPVVRWFVEQYRLLFYTSRGLIFHNTLVRSAALTFYTLLSLVPTLAIVFAVVTGFGLSDNLAKNLYELFPQSPELIEYLISFVQRALDETQEGLVAAVGIVMLFWAVIRVFSSIESAFNNIWEVKIGRNLPRKYIGYVTIIMLLPLIWILISLTGAYTREIFGLDSSPNQMLISRAISLGSTCLVLTLLYYLIPNAKVRIGSALRAGIVAGIIFALFQWGYVYIQSWMSSYNAIYGSFAALPLLLIWLQFSWQILLFGGELSFAYQNVERFEQERESLLISYESRRTLFVATMMVVVRQFLNQGGAIPSSQVVAQLKLPTRIVNETLYRLERTKLLIATTSNNSHKELGYIPAQDVHALTIYSVIVAVEGEHSVEGELDFSDSAYFMAIDQQLEQMKSLSLNSQYNSRLIDLI